MKEIIVSVIVPVYNVSKYLSKCITSILNQGIKNCEIILIDDGSTDGSSNICDYYSKKNDNIRTFHIKNMGVAYARNLGISYAKGIYIHFVDSDDSINKGMYKSISKIINNYQYDIIITGTRYDDKINDKITKYESKNKYDIKNKNDIKNFLLNINIEDKGWSLNVVWNKWIKTELIKTKKLYFRNDICPGEDFVFVVDVVIEAESLYVLNQSFYNYSVRNNNSLLRKFYSNILEIRPKIYEKHMQLYRHYNIIDMYVKQIDVNEGKYTFKSLFSILNKNCKLNRRQKYKFVKELISSDHFKYAHIYLKYKNTMSSKVYSVLLKSKNTFIAMVLIYINGIRLNIIKRSKCK